MPLSTRRSILHVMLQCPVDRFVPGWKRCVDSAGSTGELPVPDGVSPLVAAYTAPMRVARLDPTTKSSRATVHQATGGTSAATVATAALVLPTAAVSPLRSSSGLAA